MTTSKIHNRVKSVIAGPGAGKTTGLVKEIIGRLPDLAPYSYRHIAVITYTNAATADIREKLTRHCKVPPNVFIGTIHSFLNKFILMPFGSLYDKVPSDISFIDNIEISQKEKNRKSQIIHKRKITTSVIQKGFIPYDEIERLSMELIDDKRIRRLVGIRLQMIFVDEYQDATMKQHNILMEILKEAKTECFIVGDPEQYIYGFTYRGKVKMPDFSKIPILATKDKSQVEKNVTNYRSSSTIVKFLNKFNTQIQQRNTPADSNCIKELNIYFNSAADLRDIFNKFDNICCTNSLSEKHNRFYLAKGNKIVNQIHQSFGISLLSKDDGCSKNILSEALRYITGVLGKSRKEICEAKKLSTMDLRKYGMKVLRKIKDSPMIDEAEFQQFIATLFGLPISKEHKMKDSFNKMIAFNNDPKESYKHCSTIHKAKGLEAHAVLVIAETKAELLKWFETDHQRRCADKLDTCREGFVAFSRAKELLCIACLEKLDSSALETIQRLGIESI